MATSTPTSSSSSSSRQTDSQIQLNIERNHRTLPLPSTLSPSQPSNYPSIPRFPPTASNRVNGTYTLTTPTARSNTPHSRIGTSSASSSPPGTPPSGLRKYYLNAAFQRSQHPIYPMGSGSAPGPSTTLHRPSISISIPLQNTRIQVPRPALAKRSYSADQLKTNEPEIMVTTPGGTSSTESHVLTLQRALSDLIENESREEEVEDEILDDGPITMRTRKSPSPSSSSTPPGTPPHKKGATKYPKVVVDRLDPEKSPAATALLTHGAGGSDVTLAATADMAEKETRSSSSSVKAKKRAISRLSKFLYRDASMAPVDNQEYNLATNTNADLTRQPSKGGVLSNLLKLQGSGRQSKRVSRSKTSKEKKIKRPVLYSRSANHSAASLHTKSVFGTYPPLPATPSQPPMTTATTTLSNFQPNPRNNTGGRVPIQFDNSFGQSFSAMNSPFQSPNISPRGSFSAGENAFLFGASGSGTNSPGSIGIGVAALSNEEKMRITIAVADILERQDYILRLAKSMIKYGAPSHRLEAAIDHSARTLELNLQCVYLPNVMIIAFTDYETHTSETHLLKVSAGLDMYKCALVHQVHKLVTHSSIPVEEAIMRLDAINSEKDANPRWLTVLAYAVASFCTAPMFFKGSWIDAGVSFLIGGAVGMLVWLSEKAPSYAHISEITISVIVALVAEALHRYNVCQGAVKLAGIVIILPGYTITCAILELSSRHIISGSVRLFYAIMFSLLLGYGLTIGASIWTLFDPSSQGEKFTNTCPSDPLDPKWNILFVPLFAISLNIWIKAHARQWLLATILSIVGYAVSYSSSTYAGAKTEVSSALAAFAIGLLGNVYQRLTRQLTFQAVVCAVFFLVPGSMGLKGAMSLFTDDMTGGVNFALQMVITAIAISVGLFTSALVVYPMGKKTRSAQMTF
ncbi:hypothetical protein BC939DRAFT_410964 [Gamsiella multidivaricata]|uniref:uncharacterized protein n=1 Tax=Gamsiella multidivaricata TaxID=101098 RepID=UPI00221E9D21|nr:uncharacterized protein BC939DRAFT_410964 [Gamsiella multidivaricata]KAI7823552.1 hypothetical protein BC939DRAFT_410964 [Gamsiella multidivaricata]